MSVVMTATVVIGFVVIVCGFILDSVLLRCKVRSLEKKQVRTDVEFHQHIKWYGDKSRAARGEDVLDLEELLELVPESYKVTPEEVKDSGVSRVVNALPTLGVGMVRSPGAIEEELNRHVKVYGDVARMKRGEHCLGDEPFMFFIKKSLRLVTRH